MPPTSRGARAARRKSKRRATSGPGVGAPRSAGLGGDAPAPERTGDPVAEFVLARRQLVDADAADQPRRACGAEEDQEARVARPALAGQEGQRMIHAVGPR